MTSQHLFNHTMLSRRWDAFGRSVGYVHTKSGAALQTVSTGYEPETGLVSSASFTHGGEEKVFRYRYLAGMRLLESLEHPNGLTLTVSYENSRELPSRLRVARGATGVTIRDYAYDSAGRVLSRKTARFGKVVSDSFGYNTRSELVRAVLGSTGYADGSYSRKMSAARFRVFSLRNGMRFVSGTEFSVLEE